MQREDWEREFKKRNSQVKSTQRNSRQTERQSATGKSRRHKFPVSDDGEEKSIQWNSSNINSESHTDGSHYVGEMQSVCQSNLQLLSMPVRTPLITPWGPCHLLKSLTLACILDTSDLVFLCYRFDQCEFNCVNLHRTLHCSSADGGWMQMSDVCVKM